MGLTLEKAGKEVLGSAVKVVITKDSTLIVTDGSTQNAVEQRVTQLRSLVEVPTLCFSDMCPSLNLKLQTYSPYVSGGMRHLLFCTLNYNLVPCSFVLVGSMLLFRRIFVLLFLFYKVRLNSEAQQAHN